MADLSDLARELCPGVGEAGHQLAAPLRDFIEALTFADAATIRTMLDEFVVDVGPLPVWARNLAYRLVCLQRPEDAPLLREAGFIYLRRTHIQLRLRLRETISLV